MNTTSVYFDWGNMTLTQPHCGEEAIKEYATALQDFSTKPEADSSNKLLKILLLRDEVARVLTAKPVLDPALFYQLEQLDQQLQTHACLFDALIGRKTLTSWRETRQPSPGVWWWALDERAASKPSILWTLVAVLAAAATVTLTSEIVRRFLTGGTDLAYIAIPIAQATLTLLSGATLTQLGQERLDNALNRWGIARKHHQPIKTLIPLIILGLTVALFLCLPSLANKYANEYLNQPAVKLQQNGQLSEAIKSYERAVGLNPGFAAANYNLATAYEELGDYDKAQAAYQAALRANTQFYYAYNNLARLYLIQGKDADKALKLLNAVLLSVEKLNPAEPRVQYSLYKNRGWAQFVLKNYTLAVEDLEQALKLRADGAAANCLLAQVREAQQQKEKAQAHWNACEAYKTGQEDEIEASWLSLAQERLRKGEMK